MTALPTNRLKRDVDDDEGSVDEFPQDNTFDDDNEDIIDGENGDEEDNDDEEKEEHNESHGEHGLEGLDELISAENKDEHNSEEGPHGHRDAHTVNNINIHQNVHGSNAMISVHTK